MVLPPASTLRQLPSNNNNNNNHTIGFAVTITQCHEHLLDSAAVLAHSIRINHQRGDTQLYVIYHPNATQCVTELPKVGFTHLLERKVPVQINEIRGEFLRERIANNGCCGEKELLKLHAWTLTQVDIVVLLDLDTLILQPIDDLFDLILHHTPLPPQQLQWPQRTTHNATFLYTVDYAMVNPHRNVKPIQGGFLVIKPDLQVYQELVDLVREGDFRDKGGWGGVTGKFWGSMTIQGLLPFYYQIQRNKPPRYGAVELNRCYYNNMASPSRDKNDKGTCHTLEANCQDCRTVLLSQIRTTHFTVCQKPWLCQRHRSDAPAHQLCRKLHHEWFRIRHDMEISWGRTREIEGSNWTDRELFYGYCDDFGTRGYRRIQPPYGYPLVKTN